MTFKITFITAIFLLIINSLSIAMPVSQAETPLPKSEQVSEKKSIFAKSFFFKKIKKREKASALAIIAVVTGALSIPLFITGLPGAIAALIGIVTGILAIILAKNKKSRKLGIVGLSLALTWLAIGLLGLAVISFSMAILGH